MDSSSLSHISWNAKCPHCHEYIELVLIRI